MAERVSKYRLCFVYVMLAVTTFGVYKEVLHNNFINYDDDYYVTENRYVQTGLKLTNVKWAFTTNYASNWHPLTWLSLMSDSQLFGISPKWFHLTNLLLHIANTLLLFCVLNRMTGAVWKSGFVAALFALHPLHVESVAWIAERKDLLSTLFWFLTMLAYLIYAKKPTTLKYLLTLVLFALGLMAKPMLVTLPFVLLLLDYWPIGRLRSKKDFKKMIVIEKIPFFVLSAISCAITYSAQQAGGALAKIEMLTLHIRIANAFISYLSYLRRMVWPSDLAVFYPLDFSKVSLWQAAGAAVLLLVVSVLVIRFASVCRYLLTGWLWYLGTLVPVIGIVRVGSQASADRYTYVPLTGLFIIIAWGSADLLARWHRRKVVSGLLMVVILLLLSACTVVQLRSWHNSITLFEHALRVTEGNFLAHINLGDALQRQGKIDEAINHYHQSARVRPDFADAYNKLGIACGELGRYDEAIEACKQAIEIKPDYADAYCNLGVTYGKLGRYDEAIEVCKQAIRLKPDFAEAHHNLGIAYGKLGRHQEMIEACKQAIRIKPHYTDAHCNLGVAYGKLGRYGEEIEAYKQAIRIKPDFAEAHNNLGVTYDKLGRYDEAMEAFKQAIRIKPNLAEAHYTLGAIYGKLGRYDEAIEACEQAIKIKPNLAEAHYTLGAIYGKLGRYDEAIEACKQAVRIKPDYAEAHYMLGVAYGSLSRYDEAIEACKQAIKIKPDYADAHYNLGLTYLLIGDKDSASEEYKILETLDLELANKLFNLIYK